MNLDGSQVETILTLPSGSQPTGIVVDADGGKVYWSDFTRKKISRCDLDGSNTEDLFTAAEGGYVDRMALDTRGDKLYFNQAVITVNPFIQSQKIKQMNFDGSDIRTLVESAGEVGGLVFVSN